MRTGPAVGIGEIETARAGDQPLSAFGLGSCVGVTAYDPIAKVGGLAHVMLPDSPPNGRDHPNMPARYAHPALKNLMSAIEALGGMSRRLVFKLVGGARVLAVPGFSDRFDIGRRNVASITGYLENEGFTIAAKDIGGHSGRTVRFDVASGIVRVRQVGEDKEHDL